MNKELKNKLFNSTDCLSEQTMFDYIDNKLSPKEQHSVEKHMLDCDLCSDAFEGLKLLKDRNRVKVINHLIKQRISGNTGRVTGINYKVIISVAAGLLLLTGGVFFFRFSSDNLMKEKDVADLKAPAKEELISVEEAPFTADSTMTNTTRLQEPPITQNENEKGKLKTEDKEIRQDILDNITGAGSSVATGEEISPQETPIQDEDLKNIPESKTISDEVVFSRNNADQNQNYQTNESKDKISIEKEENQNSGYYAKEQSETKAAEKTRILSQEDKKKESKREESKPQTAGNVAFAPKKLEKAAKADVAKTGSTENDASDFETTITTADSLISESGMPLVLVDEMPQYPGGESEMFRFIRKNFNYSNIPPEEGNTSTKIFVQFTVNSEGVIENAKITKGINSSFDSEMLRVIKLMPKWKPGKKDGNNVPVLFNLPIILERK